MKVLVTGHDGYLGSGVVAALQADGHVVHGVDTHWFSHRSLWEPVVPEVVHHDDIRDLAPRVLDGVGAVVHLAGLSNDPLGDRDAGLTDDINHRATIRLAALARAAGVERFVFASTCSVHGGAAGTVVDEDVSMRPLTNYARAKADAERGLEAFDDGLQVVSLRFATAFGAAPRLRADLVVNNLVAWARTTGEVRLLSDGTAWRPFVHVDDISRAVAWSVATPSPPSVLEIVGPDGELRIVDVAAAVATATGADVVTAGDAGTDPRSYRVSGARARTALGAAAPRVTLAEGIAGLVDAYGAADLDSEDLHVRLRRNAWLDRLVADGRLTADLRWRDPRS